MTIRKSVLDEASSIVNGARASAYGGPEDSFNNIGSLWNSYLYARFGPFLENLCLEAHDVALMMSLMKVARLIQSPDHRDSWVDIAGYAACGAECALKEEKNAVPTNNVPNSQSSEPWPFRLFPEEVSGIHRYHLGDGVQQSNALHSVPNGSAPLPASTNCSGTAQQHLNSLDMLEEWVAKAKAQEAWKDVV